MQSQPIRRPSEPSDLLKLLKIGPIIPGLHPAHVSVSMVMTILGDSSVVPFKATWKELPRSSAPAAAIRRALGLLRTPGFAIHKRTDQATVIRRDIQKLHAESGTVNSQVPNGRGAGDEMTGAGQRETKTQNAAN